MKGLLLAVVAMSAAILSGGPAAAERHAVLVGISNYDLEGIRDLDAPVNDVARMGEVLIGLGFSPQNVRILADSLDNTRPTYANIRSTFETLSETVRPGDFVYIHFSGHGSQQVDANAEELDGLDEVFLPIDAGRAPEGTAAIVNGLVDDEMNQILTRLRLNGADVWLVVDSCHSGTFTRDPLTPAVSRAVRPSDLGVNVRAAFVGRDSPQLDNADLPAGAGGLVAFFAAQPDELAYEEGFAVENGFQSFGRLTFAIADRLERFPGLTYDELFEAVLFDVRSMQNGVRQTPLDEGGLAGKGVLGTIAVPGVSTTQFRIQATLLLAGSINRIAPGTVLSVFDDPAAAASARLGFVRVTRTLAQVAAVEAVTCPQDIPGEDCVPTLDNAFLANATFARVVAPATDLRLSFGVPVDLDCPGDRVCPPNPLLAVVEPELQRLAAARPGDFGALIEINSASPNINLGLAEGALWFAPFGERFDQFGDAGPPGAIAWRPEDGQAALDEIVRLIVKARDLLLVTEALAQASQTERAPISIGVTVEPSRAADLVREPDGAFDPAGECRFAGREEPRAFENQMNLKQCDRLMITARATRAGSFTIHVIAIDPLLNIQVAQRTIVDGTALELALRAIPVCSECQPGANPIPSVGDDRVLIIVSENLEGLNNLDLRDWEQEGITRGLPDDATLVTRGPQDLLRLLLAPTEEDRSRGTQITAFPEDLWVTQLEWTTVPRIVAITMD